MITLFSMGAQGSNKIHQKAKKLHIKYVIFKCKYVIHKICNIQIQKGTCILEIKQNTLIL